MTGAGYAKDGKGIWAKGGNEVAFKIEDPSAYTDYYQTPPRSWLPTSRSSASTPRR